ncbi:MAG: phosphoribosylformylglycinamidine cyclo-ligase [Gemmatimonadetes bacterium]|nr:phosphoribosylformylglycinamidine cyclo-ligase [Gemmatimonadota bacterium]
MSLSYRDAGVDRDAAAIAKLRMRELVDSTRTDAVRAGFGSFGGHLALAEGEELVASVDGVGTKLEVAVRAGRHDTVGEDLVNHCVNDILAEGAVPLAFLDYFACGKLDPEVVVEVVRGVARGCRRNGCALLGGETAEMPGFYRGGVYDLVGFIVGRLEFPAVAAREVRGGDVLIGLESSGIHTNGFSFARAVIFGRMGLEVGDPWPGLPASVGEVLLRVHRSYLGPLREECAAGRVRALAHITGGGIPGKMSAILPEHLGADFQRGSWTVPRIFDIIQHEGDVSTEEMYEVFNMGLGMVAVCPEDNVSPFQEQVPDAQIVGRIIPREGDAHVTFSGG